MKIDQKNNTTDSIEISRTDNFWIDNGIVGLYKILLKALTEERKDIHKIEFIPRLSIDKLQIHTNNHSELEQLLAFCLKLVTENYLYAKGEKSVGWYYDEENQQFNIYYKKNWALHLAKTFFKGKTPSTEGGLLTPDKGKSENLSRKKRIMTNEELIAFKNFREKNNQYKLEEKGILNSPPAYELNDVFEPEFIQTGKKVCQLSGTSWKKVKTINGINFPFISGDSGGINFRSNLTAAMEMSSLYAFISMFSLDNLYYSRFTKSEKETIFHFFLPYDSVLLDLSAFYNALGTIEETDPEKRIWSNYKKEIQVTQYQSESLLAFLLSVYKNSKRELIRDKLYKKSIYGFIHDGNIFQEVHEFNKVEPLFNFFDKFEDIDLFIRMLWGFVEPIKGVGKQDNTIFREQLARRLLTFMTINDVIEEFLFVVKLKQERSQYYLSDFTQLYNEEVLNMDKTMVALCKSIGNRIGRKCRETQDKGILYALRNAKNRSDFLKVLSDSQYKTEISYSEEFFIALPDSPEWEEYKSLVSIFAMNSFLYNPDKKDASAN